MIHAGASFSLRCQRLHELLAHTHTTEPYQTILERTRQLRTNAIYLLQMMLVWFRTRVTDWGELFLEALQHFLATAGGKLVLHKERRLDAAELLLVGNSIMLLVRPRITFTKTTLLVLESSTART